MKGYLGLGRGQGPGGATLLGTCGTVAGLPSLKGTFLGGGLGGVFSGDIALFLRYKEIIRR